MKKTRVLFEQALAEKVQHIRDKVARKQKEKAIAQETSKKKGFANLYEMSYNEVRQEAKKNDISTWRKTKEELIEELIQQHKKLH
jgi:hypothetical protein